MRLSFESPLRKPSLRGAVSLVAFKASHEWFPPESLEHEQTSHGGLAGTWEVLTVPRHETAYVGWPCRSRTSPGPGPWHLGPPGANADATVVPPSEGNEARREDRQEVLAPSQYR